MKKSNSASLDAEIERYRKQMMKDYHGRGEVPKNIPPPPDVPAPPIKPPIAPPIAPSPPDIPVPASHVTPEQEYADFVSENPQRGNIKTQTFTARGAYPVKDVTVTISKMFESGEYIISTQKTDISGQTDPVSVPTPDIDLSESPGQAASPFSSFTVKFAHPSFATVISQQLPVFSGTTALQTVNMVPVSASPHGSTTIKYITTEPSDL